MPDHTSFPPPSVDEEALEELNSLGRARLDRLVAVLGKPRHLTLSVWAAERTREWELSAVPSKLAVFGAPLDYEVSRQETVDEFRADRELDAALTALVDAIDLGVNLAYRRFCGEDDECALSLATSAWQVCRCIWKSWPPGKPPNETPRPIGRGVFVFWPVDHGKRRKVLVSPPPTSRRGHGRAIPARPD